MAAKIIRLERRPRYSPAIAAEGWMEIAEAARRNRVFIESELRHSFERGHDTRRQRELQSAWQDAAVIESQGRKHAGWADAVCADGVAEPGHGRAA